MDEQIINLEITKIYSKMKQFITNENYPIIIDNPNVQLSIKQGSVWGIQPKTAKKIINYNFSPIQSSTKIQYLSTFSSEWKKLTVLGYIFSIFLIILSFWISLDLQNYILTGNGGFWSWIVTSNIAYSNLIQSFSDLARLLAIFLILVIFIETFIVLYSKIKINEMAKEILNKSQNPNF